MVLSSPYLVGVRGLNTKTSLPDALIEISVRRELISEGRQLDRPNRVKPVRIGLLELITRIEHREPIDLKVLSPVACAGSGTIVVPGAEAGAVFVVGVELAGAAMRSPVAVPVGAVF